MESVQHLGWTSDCGLEVLGRAARDLRAITTITVFTAPR